MEKETRQSSKLEKVIAGIVVSLAVATLYSGCANRQEIRTYNQTPTTQKYSDEDRSPMWGLGL